MLKRHFVDRVTEDDSVLVERKILFCTEAKQFKVQSVELVQFSYRLWIDSPESLECPEKGTQMRFKVFSPVLGRAIPAPLSPNEARVNVEVQFLAQVGHVSGQGVQMHYNGIPA